MICKRCNMYGNFSWDLEWFKKTAKWRLIDNDHKQPHICVKRKKIGIQWDGIQDEPNYQEPIVFITREQYEEMQERTKSLRSQSLKALL